MSDYPKWAHKAKIPNGLRLVTHEEARAAVSVGAEARGYYIDNIDGLGYLQKGIDNFCKGDFTGDYLWELTICDLNIIPKGCFLVTFLVVE